MEKLLTEQQKVLDRFAKLNELILSEVDLSYAEKQNVLLSCSRDGCVRINYCSCDCNNSGW